MRMSYWSSDVCSSDLKNGGTCNDDKGAAGRRGNIGHCFRSSNHCGCSVGFSAEVICKLRSSVQALVQGDHGPTEGGINGGLARPTHRPGGGTECAGLGDRRRRRFASRGGWGAYKNAVLGQDLPTG